LPPSSYAKNFRADFVDPTPKLIRLSRREPPSQILWEISVVWSIHWLSLVIRAVVATTPSPNYPNGQLMKLTLQQLEAHLWGAANILRGKTAGQDYKNYILSLMFFKRLCDQWETEADDAIAELERQQGRTFTEQQKAVFRKRGEHRFKILDGSHWSDAPASRPGAVRDAASSCGAPS
jgi:type I restriction enzyme M protein